MNSFLMMKRDPEAGFGFPTDASFMILGKQNQQKHIIFSRSSPEGFDEAPIRQ
jgi:hypothetical protein